MIYNTEYNKYNKIHLDNHVLICYDKFRTSHFYFLGKCNSLVNGIHAYNGNNNAQLVT